MLVLPSFYIFGFNLRIFFVENVFSTAHMYIHVICTAVHGQKVMLLKTSHLHYDVSHICV